MKIRVISVFMAVILTLSIACCFNSCGREKEFPVNIGEVVIKSEPENIVVLDKNLADIISCIGYDVKMVGRSDEVNQEFLEVVPAVGTKADPDLEKIKGLDTDMVITDMSMDESLIKTIKKAGIKVVQFGVAQTQKQLNNTYKNIGRVLGGNVTGVAKGDGAYKELNETLENIKSAAEYDSVVRTACYLYISDGVLKTMNKGTWGDIILKDTSAINVFEHAETDVVKNEELKIANPDFIFCSGQDVIDYLNNNDTLYELDGLDNTCVIKYDEITMQGYTSLDVLEVMLRCIYPDQFGD